MSTIEVGKIIEGTVVGVQPFGVFVSIGDSKQGLVHISQISSAYVEDIHQAIKVSDKVKVRVTEIKSDGKISLTMRVDEEPRGRSSGSRPPSKRRDDRGPGGGQRQAQSPKDDFESLMKKWMRTSEDRMGDLGKRERRK